MLYNNIGLLKAYNYILIVHIYLKVKSHTELCYNMQVQPTCGLACLEWGDILMMFLFIYSFHKKNSWAFIGYK